MKPYTLASSLALLFGVSVAPLFAQSVFAASSKDDITPEQYSTVLAGNWRAPENSARDQYRHPQQTLSFFGLRDNQRVVEITPGNGWYSEVLGPLLKDHGHYVAAVQAPDGKEATAKSNDALRKKLADDPAHYGKAEIVEFTPGQPVFGPPGSADVVLTFRNVHNWVMADNAEAMFKGFYQVLKPGGVLGVVDHRARAGVSLDEIKQSGYLPPSYVIKLASQAGFKLVGQSEVNANPKDTKDYADGVWTLPPTLRDGNVNRDKYLAIGESDRMTLRFIKKK